MSKKIDLSIVILNYNTRQLTYDCIESILENTADVNFEIILIDNNSTDGSQDFLSKKYKDHKTIKIVFSDTNLGFGRGNNLGSKHAKGEYLLFLNSDTLIPNSSISKAFEEAKKNKNLGVYSVALKNADGSSQVSGGAFPTLFNIFAWQLFLDDLPFVGAMIKSFHPHSNDSFVPEWVTGAFMIVKKDFFQKAGGFDKNIFMYTEEMELCFRLNKLGKDILYQPDIAITHLGGASSGSYLALTSEIKNMIYFFKKHYKAIDVFWVKIFFLMGSFLRLIIFGIIKNDEKSRRIYKNALGFIL